jgi:hypothetical protein
VRARTGRVLARALPLLLLAAAPAAFAATATFRAGRVDGPAGGVVTVPIVASASAPMSSMQGALRYDAAILAVEEVVAGPALPEGGRADFNADEPGRLFLGFVCSPSKPAFRGEGTVLSVRFRVKGQVGQVSALELSRVRAWEPEDAEVLVQVEPGAVTVVAARSPMLLFFVVAGVALLLILVVALRRRRRREPAARDARPRAAPAAGATASFCTACGAKVEGPGRRFCARCGAALV